MGYEVDSLEAQFSTLTLMRTAMKKIMKFDMPLPFLV